MSKCQDHDCQKVTDVKVSTFSECFSLFFFFFLDAEKADSHGYGTLSSDEDSASTFSDTESDRTFILQETGESETDSYTTAQTFGASTSNASSFRDSLLQVC